MKPEDLNDMVNRKDIYDTDREESLRSMAATFYSRQMRSTAIMVWVNFLVFATLAAGSVFLLFRAQDIRYQLLFAALLVCCLQWATLSKTFAWQMLHRHRIEHAIKRLEIRLVEMEDRLRTRAEPAGESPSG